MTNLVDYMHSHGKRGSEPVLGEREFFTAGTQAPARHPHLNKHGMEYESSRVTHPILTPSRPRLPCAALFTRGFHSRACFTPKDGGDRHHAFNRDSVVHFFTRLNQSIR